jgi:hypothetical protein
MKRNGKENQSGEMVTQENYYQVCLEKGPDYLFSKTFYDEHK